MCSFANCSLCRWGGSSAVRGRDVVAFSGLINILGRGLQNYAQWTMLRGMDTSKLVHERGTLETMDLKIKERLTITPTVTL